MHALGSVFIMGVFLNDGHVLITGTKFTVDNNTYILSGIAAIRKRKVFNLYPAAVMVLIFLCFLIGFSHISELWCIVSILLSLAVARWEDNRHKVVFRIYLGTLAGVFKVMESEDEEYVDNVITVLTKAVAPAPHS